MLHEFLTEEREELIARCEAKVATRRSPAMTEAELENGVPRFLDQLIDTLRRDLVSIPEISESGKKHGDEMVRSGFTVDEVVHEYGDVCQAVTELADERSATITVDEFHTLNKCLDDAIAGAVTEHERQHEQVVSGDQTERLGEIAHELRTLINSARLAFDALSSGRVGVAGSTGAVLARSLTGLAKLVDRSIAEVRLDAGVQNRERVALADFVAKARASASVDAKARSIHFTVAPVEEELAVEADRQSLAAVVSNLLGNAFTFSKPGGTVTFGARASSDRVLIEIADECGGLPAGRAEELLHLFEERDADRTGLGRGLAVCLRGVEANGGTLHVRDVAGRGCVVTIDLPTQHLAEA